MLIKRNMSVSITPIEVNVNINMRLSLEMTITSWRRVLPSTGAKPPEIAQNQKQLDMRPLPRAQVKLGGWTRSPRFW